MRSSVTKRLDMARSILPSKSRDSAAAALADIRRRNRHRVDRRLRRVVLSGLTDEALVEDLLDDCDLRAYPNAAINDVVRWRRAADKLNHFERWAVRGTRDMRREDRLSHMRAILPGGLIGEHAVSHLRVLPEFDTEEDWWPRYPVVPFDHDRDQLRAFLFDVLAHGSHGQLNVMLKREPHSGNRVTAVEHQVRCLLGRHDVDAFLDHLYANARPYQAPHPEWLALVRRLANERAI